MYRLNASAGTLTSAVLHVAAGAFVVVGWPYLNPPAPQALPPIPVELISEAELAERVEVPEQSRAEEPPEEPEPQVVDEPEEEPPAEETPPEPEPQPDPEPEPEPEPVLPPEPEETPEEAPEEPDEEPEPDPDPPQPDPEPAEDELDFASLEEGLVDLDPDRRDAPKEVADAGEGADVDADRVGLGNELLATEEAKVRACIEREWLIQDLLGAPNIEDRVVVVTFTLNEQAEIVGQPRARTASGPRDRYSSIAADRGVQAVIACSPYEYLTPDRFDVWREWTMNFRLDQL